jgi:aspartyl protease family protein
MRLLTIFFLVALAILLVGGGALLSVDRTGTVLGLMPGDFVRVLVLVAVTVFVGAGLIGRNTFGRAVRYSLSWVLILVGLVALYANREQVEWMARRMVAELIPGRPMMSEGTGTEGERTVEVGRAFGGHFQVEAAVNGATVDMLVDTGASLVTLTYDDAIAAGIGVDELNFGINVFTANGATTAAPVILDRLAVGPIERRRIPALVARPATLDSSLLGLSFLDTLGGFSISGDRLVLQP